MSEQSFEELEAKIFRDMTRDGCTASAQLQKECFVKWQSGFPGGYSNLAALMNRAEPVASDHPYPYHRVADALVQKLRKAELITRHGRNWHAKRRGTEFRNYLEAKA